MTNVLTEHSISHISSLRNAGGPIFKYFAVILMLSVSAVCLFVKIGNESDVGYSLINENVNPSKKKISKVTF